MLYRDFGKTEERVSILGFGCMRLPVTGSDPTNIDEDAAIKMMHYAIDRGVNYVDTAYPYHGAGFNQGGASEPLVAKALKNGYRERVNLATKLPSWLIKTRSDMDKYLNEQLERLETDTIDFYLAHSLNANVWPVLRKAGITEFFDQAIKDGRIKYAGFSFHDQVNLFKEIVDDYDWSFCQIQYNYLDEDFQAGKEGLDYAAKKGLGIAIMEPLRGGNIVNLPKEAKAIMDRAHVQRSAAEWGLRWVWNHPEVSLVLSGMTTMDHVVENVKVAQDAEPHALTTDELEMFDQIKKVFQEKIKVNCTACGYCMPCPAGINIPRCFSIYNDHWVFDGSPLAKKSYAVMSKMSTPPSKCAECGKCESHCPQGIAIPQELKNVTAIFE
ncbi:aldo/keto reductase [Candidatus Formimonas warabiya]|uniref:Aldo/keto reductase n=1 Tax=Formimonas warabiya TaxID=1761012 RepID=A0A3G1KWT5_FORW1|nr:aldo/keto reductase [Candidatus Formimonas warabiya]ATW26857.1 aldo/keto reductase [Candidatus Formimonas warabiya]